MDNPHDPDFGPHPNLNHEPLQTGLPAETQVDRDSHLAQTPDWIIDRISATWLMLVLIAVLVGIGGYAIWFVLDFPFWPIGELSSR